MHKASIRRVGWVLLVFALGDLARMLFAAIYQHSHEYFFNFTLLGAAIALLCGNQRTAHTVRRFAAFLTAILFCFAVFWFFSEPLSLLWAEIRLDTADTIGDVGSFAILMIVCAWVAWELGKVPVSERSSWVTGKVAFGGGVALCALIAAILLPMAYGKTGARAIAEAQTKLGPGYHYHLTSLSWEGGSNGTHIGATVAAWNDTKIVAIPVSWDE